MRRTALLLSLSLIIPVFGLSLWAQAQEQRTQKETEAEKQAAKIKITEEIQVVGKAPKDQPIATVTRIESTAIDANRPLDLAEAMRYAPGVNITYGNKYEFTLKLRGMDSRRIALLIDGVPSYEPYYGSFDLKTVAASDLNSIQISKGPASVLYGPNTLAGIVNVVTRRPGDAPYLNLTGSYGERATRAAGFDGGFRAGAFSLAGDARYQDSKGFDYPDAATGDRIAWANTDYKRLNVNAKAYYAPSSSTEIMINGGLYQSTYGMPSAVAVQKARYWHFKDWDRYTLNAGGYTALGGSSTLRFRAFYVGYKNTLDQYKDAAMSVRQFESTFDNSVYGAFALADLGLASWNTLKLSLNYQKDVARTQDDVGLAWTEYHQGTFSAAAEEHIALGERWSLIGGASLDVIDKFTGGSTSRINPLVGLKFTPSDALDLHLSFAQKSRMPNMRAMYSPTNGNPDLLSETGTNAEAGFSWAGPVDVSGAVFLYEFKNMIDTMVLADGTKKYWNVGRARINGLELQVRKSLGWIEGTVNCTYLDHRNETNDRPLDALSASTLNFDVAVRPLAGLRVGFYGLAASASSWYDSTANKILSIPGYFNLDAVASYDLGRVSLFLKATNIFNAYFYSEPVFPWRARFIEAGASIKVF
jgi:outer membrane cobalamin receptor